MQLIFTTTDLQENQQLVITGKIYQHLIQVLRLAINDRIEVVGSNEVGYAAQITNINSDTKQVSLLLGNRPLMNTELPIDAEIICGLPKREKSEWIVQKSTELGVKRIIFYPAQRSIMNWRKEQVEKKLNRLQQIAQSAAEQAHRRYVPEVCYWPNLINNLPTDGQNLVAYEEVVKGQQDLQLAQQLRQARAQVIQTSKLQSEERPIIRMIFGPEGGLTIDEVNQLSQQSVTSVGLGPRILRTETAPLYFLSSLSYAIEIEALTN